MTIHWQDILPADAVNLNLTERLDITAPLNENGERCPWPWEPQQLGGAPIGQFRCSYCLAMCVAGLPHLDYQPGWDDPNEDELQRGGDFASPEGGPVGLEGSHG